MQKSYIFDLLTMKEAADVVKKRYNTMTYANFQHYVSTGRVPIATVKNGHRLFERADIENWELVKWKTGRVKGKANAKSEEHPSGNIEGNP